MLDVYTIDKPEVLIASEDIEVFKVCLLNLDVPGTAVPYFKSESGIIYKPSSRLHLDGDFDFVIDDEEILWSPGYNHRWVIKNHSALFYSFSLKKCSIGKPYDPEKIATHMICVVDSADTNERDFFHLPAIPEQDIKERVPCFVRCIVPKGSKYYEYYSGEIISDTIEAIEIISVDDAFKDGSCFRKTTKSIFVV